MDVYFPPRIFMVAEQLWVSFHALLKLFYAFRDNCVDYGGVKILRRDMTVYHPLFVPI